MSRTIAVVQQKGGSGKTTSTCSLASLLSEKGKAVLVVDGDSQGNVADSFNINKLDLPFTLYELLLGRCETKEAIIKAPIADKPFLDVLPSNLLLAGIDLEIGGEISREFLLKIALDEVKHDYDYILIDCGPQLGLVTINAMAAANEILIPVETSYLCVQGLSMLLKTYTKVKTRINSSLSIAGAFFTKVDHTRDSREVMDDMLHEFSRLGIHLYETRIRQNVRLKEASRYGAPIDLMAPTSPGAEDYRALADEILAQEQTTEVTSA